mmetsp:Transcript_34928/g.65156  ORF Transcript_34928/g.65156 Transcript_34928/m.65156 type:complete len:253 (-) Transcript_34928:6715-7473(-)
MLYRPRPVQFNPLLEVIELLTNEVVEDVASTVGKTSIQELVSEHLADRELYNALHDIVTGVQSRLSLWALWCLADLVCMFPVVAEVMGSCVLEAAEDAMLDARCINIRNAILTSFLRSSSTGIQAVAQECLQEEVDSVANFQRQRDRNALKITLQTSFGRRAVLSHLMASMANRFDRVLMTHFTKGVCRRSVIQRLLNLMDNIEARVQPVMRVSVHHHVLELQLACYPPQITELCRALVGPTFVLCDVRVAG